MLSLSQPVTELAYSSANQCSARTVGNEPKGTLERNRDQPLHSAQTQRSTKTYKSPFSSSFPEEEANFRSPENRNNQQFALVETPTEFYESEAVESSSDEEFYAFDGGDACAAGPLQNQQVYRMKARNAELYRTACNKMSHPQRDEEKTRMRREEMAQEGKDSRDRSQARSFLQANPRGFSQYEESHSPNTNTRVAYSRYQVQDRTRQILGTEEQQSQLLAPACRYGRQEVCEERNSECCKKRRIGVCKQTDTTQDQRTFVRVLGKRF